MDMHTTSPLRMTLPGEVAQGGASPPPAAPTEQGAKPSFTSRISNMPRKYQLLAGVGVIAIGVVGAVGLQYAGRPGSSQMQGFHIPSVAHNAPASPFLETAQVQAPRLAPQPAMLAAQEEAAPVPAVARREPAPTVLVTPPPAIPAEPDALAEHRQLLAQATAPLPVSFSVPAPSEEVAKLSAMVTSLSALLGDSLKGQIQLRREVAELQASVRTGQVETNQRIAFIEARQTVAATLGVAAGPQAAAPAAAPAARPAAAPSSPNAGTTYRITGAASNLAYLVAVNPAPGQPATMEARPGSDVPGYGKVRAIAQKGTTWEVVTERGTITN